MYRRRREETSSYFWYEQDNQIIQVPGPLTDTDARAEGYKGMYCVDTASTDPAMRYGMFSVDSAWIHIPIEQFPPEFKLQLLLLNIT